MKTSEVKLHDMIRKVFVDMCMREYIIVAKFVEFIAKTNDCMIKIYTRKKYHKNICKNGDVDLLISSFVLYRVKISNNA